LAFSVLKERPKEGEATMRALIVDDDQTSCQLLAQVLMETGLDAEWTTDSLTGYTLSLRQHYDLFVLDVRMPLLLGTEFAEGLKKDNPAAKIILISAFADEALQETAAALGVSLLSKPFTPDRLLKITAEVLGQAT
jgi:DNA-binding response OmpR family regulator